MIGTNDVKGIYEPMWGEGTIESFDIREGEISFSTFRRNMSSIITRLVKYSNAPIAIHTLPPMGEDLDSEANGFVVKANGILKDAVQRSGSSRVRIVDSHASLEKFVLEVKTPEQITASMSVDKFGDVLAPIALKEVLLGKSLDDCGSAYGNVIMSDSLHLNDTGAKIVGDAVLEWLKDVEV